MYSFCIVFFRTLCGHCVGFGPDFGLASSTRTNEMTSETGRTDATDKKTPTVLFDGRCPMCRREIAHYRLLRGAERIEWVDITQHPAIEATFGVTRSAAMARFHVRRPDGVWLTGAWAFAELWSHLRGYRYLATFVRRLRLVPLLDWGYVRFARWRLRRHCKDGSCATS